MRQENYYNIIIIRGDMMPKKAGQRSETNYYHIVMRGNNKSYICADNPSKSYLMELLNKIELE